MTQIAVLIEKLPLKINEAQWSDPTLTLIGDEWSLALTCPWRLIRGDDFIAAWSSDDVEDRMWDLIGADIIRIDRQVSASFSDPVFHLSGGIKLEVFSDSGMEPWSIRIGDLIVVGPLKGADWA